MHFIPLIHGLLYVGFLCAPGILHFEESATRNARTAAHPSTVRTEWRRFHFTINARVWVPASAGAVSASIRLVGMMPKMVQGQFARSNMAPTTNANLPVVHQARIPRPKPMSASGACMENPRV